MTYGLVAYLQLSQFTQGEQKSMGYGLVAHLAQTFAAYVALMSRPGEICVAHTAAIAHSRVTLKERQLELQGASLSDV